MSGYIKDHRKELDSDIWLMPPLYHRTWQWLKYNVNHSDNEIPMRDGSKLLIKRGQRLTSVRDIAKGISWYEGMKYKEPNPKTISTILEWMVKTDMITISNGQGNRQYTLVTLINYEVYNEKENQGNSKVTAEKQSADINNNDNNELIKNIYSHWNKKKVIVHKELPQTMKEAINARLQVHGLEALIQAIDNYSDILMSDTHYYSHKFTLKEFMNTKNVDKFLTDNKPFETFLKNQPSFGKSQTVPPNRTVAQRIEHDPGTTTLIEKINGGKVHESTGTE